VTMVPLLYAALDVSAEYCQPHPDVVVIIVRLLGGYTYPPVHPPSPAAQQQVNTVLCYHCRYVLPGLRVVCLTP
jgi:hypothetical protein